MMSTDFGAIVGNAMSKPAKKTAPKKPATKPAPKKRGKK